MRLRNDWRWLRAVTFTATALSLTLVGVLACGPKEPPVPDAPPGADAPAPPGVSPPPPVIGLACNLTALAAVDLSGQCRATPQATMGALEAVPE